MLFDDNDAILHVRDAADYLKMPLEIFDLWKLMKTGPQCIKRHSSDFYRLEDLRILGNNERKPSDVFEQYPTPKDVWVAQLCRLCGHIGPDYLFGDTASLVRAAYSYVNHLDRKDLSRGEVIPKYRYISKGNFINLDPDDNTLYSLCPNCCQQFGNWFRSTHIFRRNEIKHIEVTSVHLSKFLINRVCTAAKRTDKYGFDARCQSSTWHRSKRRCTRMAVTKYGDSFVCRSHIPPTLPLWNRDNWRDKSPYGSFETW